MGATWSSIYWWWCSYGSSRF